MLADGQFWCRASLLCGRSSFSCVVHFDGAQLRHFKPAALSCGMSGEGRSTPISLFVVPAG